MRSRFLLVGLAVVATLTALSWLSFRWGPSRGRGASVPQGEPAAVGVEVLVEHPERYPAEVQVTGLVGRVAPERQLFLLVDMSDREELLKTGITQCVTLPVRWVGPMPSLQDAVVVWGEVAQRDGKFVFVATAIHKIQLGAPLRGPR